MSYEYLESPNKSSRKGNQVSGLIAHFTAGGSLDSSVNFMRNQVVVPKNLQGKTGSGYVTIKGVTYYNANASAHYITGRDGKTVMLVPESMAAWHAGSSTTTPKLNGKANLNLWTIGHEICNWGPLVKDGDNFYTNAGGWTSLYKGPTPVCLPRVAPKDLLAGYRRPSGKPCFPDGTIDYWEPYTAEQIKSVIVLWKEIVTRYNITREWISGHEQVDPLRKCDPGAAFPWGQVMAEVFQKPVINRPPTPFVDPDLTPIPSATPVSSPEEVDMAERMINSGRGNRASMIGQLLANILK